MTPDQEVKLKTATTWIPLTLVVSIIGLVVYATWVLSQERSQIYGQIGQVSADVKGLSENVKDLAIAINRPNATTMTKQEWMLDCLRLQIANPNWTCLYSASSTHAKEQRE